jgi:polyribonucleotide nucleotidyltransferase
MGLVMGERMASTLSSRILGDEDHMGDMDFKVAGTFKGITASRWTSRIGGVTEEIFTNALEQPNRVACIFLNG